MTTDALITLAGLGQNAGGNLRRDCRRLIAAGILPAAIYKWLALQCFAFRCNGADLSDSTRKKKRVSMIEKAYRPSRMKMESESFLVLYREI